MSVTTSVIFLGLLTGVCIAAVWKLKKRVQVLEKRCNEEFSLLKAKQR